MYFVFFFSVMCEVMVSGDCYFGPHWVPCCPTCNCPSIWRQMVKFSALSDALDRCYTTRISAVRRCLGLRAESIRGLLSRRHPLFFRLWGLGGRRQEAAAAHKEIPAVRCLISQQAPTPKERDHHLHLLHHPPPPSRLHSPLAQFWCNTCSFQSGMSSAPSLMCANTWAQPRTFRM